MQPTIINPTTLATGIKYPAAVTKAYAEQEAAAAEHTKAIIDIAAAEAQLATAKAEDQRALVEAASARSGHPGKEKTPDAERALAYAHEVGTQVQARYIAAADNMRRVMSENAEAILPLAIELARKALENYDNKIVQIQQLIVEANSVMQNGAYGLNMLRQHVPYVNFSVNWLPVTIPFPHHNQLGNMAQVADQLERVLKERATPKAVAQTWPSGGNAGDIMRAAGIKVGEADD